MPNFHVVLYQPEIPHNTGAVGRLCLAVGARLHLIKPLGFSLDDRQLKRAGLDYWPEVDLRVWDSWEAFVVACPGPVFLFSTKVQHSLWETAFPSGSYLVFGPETRGLPESLLCAQRAAGVRIPMQSAARSLNLATAVAIGLYEAARQCAALDIAAAPVN